MTEDELTDQLKALGCSGQEVMDALGASDLLADAARMRASDSRRWVFAVVQIGFGTGVKS